MPTIRTVHINYKGKSVQYKVIGESAVSVFLIHGFTEDSTVWKNQMGFIKNCQLVIPDLPGTGESEIQEIQTMDGIADMIRMIAKQENIEKMIMIGHSMGGYISLAFAKKYPDRLLGLGLFHSSALADTDEKKQSRDKSIKFLQSNNTLNFIKTAVPDLYFDKEKNAAIIEAHIAHNSGISQSVLIQQLHMMKDRPDSREVLKNLQIPILWILGEHDKAVPFQSGLDQVPLANNVTLGILRSSAHMGMLEEPVKANKILQEFIDILQ